MQINDYGEKCEGFNLVINASERYNRPMFISTNLTEEQILARYGERTDKGYGALSRFVSIPSCRGLWGLCRRRQIATNFEEVTRLGNPSPAE